MIVAIAGATGLTGNLSLKMLLENSDVTRVIAIGRRSVGITHPKLSEEILNDGKLSSTPKCDAFICCLGTTIKKAGSQEAFIAVDLDLPLYLARELHKNGCNTSSIVSAMGADEKSAFFYNRVKGQVERGMRNVGFKSLSILRPSLIVGDRKESRAAEQIAEVVMNAFNPLMVGPLKNFRSIHAEQIAAALVATVLESEPGVRVILSEEIKRV